MERIARFEKVSYGQFKKDWVNAYGETDDVKLKEVYDNIKLPTRATSGSAGYDFYLPTDLILKPGEEAKIITGVRCFIQDGWALYILSKSGLGSRYRLHLNTCVSLFDSDYYYADNEGHFIYFIINDSRQDKVLELKAGAGFLQGVFVQFGITEDDIASGKRTGGLGSTYKIK